MQCVTAVDGLWLAELGPMFFSVKESNLSRMVALILVPCIAIKLLVFVQERKLATKRKLGQMEEELAAASEQIKAQKEEEISAITKSARLVVL